MSSKKIMHERFYIRLVMAIVFGIATYPIFVAAWAMLGVFSILSFVGIIAGVFVWIATGNKSILKESSMAFCIPFIAPVLGWRAFVLYGEFDELVG